VIFCAALDEQRMAARRQPARSRERDVVDLLDLSRTWRHHDDAVGEQHRFVDRMRNEQNGLSRLHPEIFQIDAHLLARERIERAERLVHQEQRRVVDQRAHDRGALPHAAGEFARPPVMKLGEADFRQKFVCTRNVGLGIEAAQLELKQDVAENIAPFEQDRTLKYDAEIRLCAGDLITVELYAAAGVAQQAGDDAQQCALCRSPTARRSQQTRPAEPSGRSDRARASSFHRGERPD